MNIPKNWNDTGSFIAGVKLCILFAIAFKQYRPNIKRKQTDTKSEIIAAIIVPFRGSNLIKKSIRVFELFKVASAEPRNVR